MTWTADFTDNATGRDLRHTIGAGHGPDCEAIRRCALAFNPGSHHATFAIKIACAAAMQTIVNERDSTKTAYNRRKAEADKAGEPWPDAEEYAFQDAMRCFATALTDLESAQMFGVKGLHTRSNAGLS